MSKQAFSVTLGLWLWVTVILGLAYIGLQPADPQALRQAQERLRQSEEASAAASQRLKRAVDCLPFGCSK